MSSLRSTVSPRSQHVFSWDRRFCIRQPRAYPAEDTRVQVTPPEDPVSAFLDDWQGVLDPPCYNYQLLKAFLDKGKLEDLTVLTPPADLPKIVLIDDRKDPSGQIELVPGHPVGSDGSSRDWTSEAYSGYPTQGENIHRDVVDEWALYKKLCENRETNGAERRVLFVTDLTPHCAIAIATNISWRFVPVFRAYLQRYLISQVYFQVKLGKADFRMEFHLPYLALRDGPVMTDPRKVRHYHPMLKSVDEHGAVIKHEDDLVYHDAQISFLITGVDEWSWTAYCCVETFFKSEQNLENYKAREEDGPSGGARDSKYPAWNPREYFLIVLSRRMAQATGEWRNIISELNKRLDSYEAFYNHTIESDDFFDDSTLSRTKAYTRAVSILCQFHDMLNLTIETFLDFCSQDLQYFETGSDTLDDYWKGYIDSLFDDLADLRLWQRTLLQRIQTFNRMKDGLVNSSTLQESRYSTKQGRDINILTNVTVAYLPFSLAAALFSMSTNNLSSSRWIYWMATSIVLTIVTFYLSFKNKLVEQWSEVRGKLH